MALIAPTLVSPPRTQLSSGHHPVMLAEVVDALAPRGDGRYIDGTFGGGGHTSALLNASAPGGLVLALDADERAVTRGEQLARETSYVGRLRVRRANFADLRDIATAEDFVPVDGVLLDLGLSSFQLDEAGRGFAFRLDGPLDMRFDQSHGATAADLVNTRSEAELADLLYRFGEEPRSRRIARAIARERERGPIVTTTALAALVSDAVGGRRGSDTHPATRTFQALRIAINAELDALESALAAAVEILVPTGRLAIVSFHSLEDRIVKRFIERERVSCVCPPRQPICTCVQQPRLRKLSRAIRPTAAEIAANPRARSATLRVAERLATMTGSSA